MVSFASGPYLSTSSRGRSTCSAYKGATSLPWLRCVLGSGLSREYGLQCGSASRGEGCAAIEKEAARGDFCRRNAASDTVGRRTAALGTCERNAEKDGAWMAARLVFLCAFGVEARDAVPGVPPCCCCCCCACAVAAAAPIAGDSERTDAVPVEVYVLDE